MKIKLFSVAAFIATCSIAAAQDATQCAQISNPDDRLNCFDSLYKEVSIPEAKGDWVVKVTSSPLDDTKTVVLTLNSDDGLFSNDRLSDDRPRSLKADIAAWA
jgi:hypothetical protein